MCVQEEKSSGEKATLLRVEWKKKPIKPDMKRALKFKSIDDAVDGVVKLSSGAEFYNPSLSSVVAPPPPQGGGGKYDDDEDVEDDFTSRFQQ
jgi:hypothetical protein